jgi:hypothetical protein
MIPSLAVLACLAAAGDPAATGDLLLLPADGTIAVCARADAPEVFPGAELYGLIDGGAELFLELGFERATVQRYACAGQEVTLELYHMRDGGAALGVYLAKCGRETPDPELATRHTVGRLQLQLLKGAFYIVATGERPAEALRAALVGLAGSAASKVPAAADDPLAALPREALVVGSGRLIRGPFALQAMVTLGEGDVLQLQANGVTALGGEYTDGAGARYCRVLADYPSAAAAAGAFANVRDTLDPYLTPLERSDARLVFRDHAGRFGAVTLADRRVEVTANLATRP